MVLPSLMNIMINGLPFTVQSVGWGSRLHTEQALEIARGRLQADPGANLEQLAVDAARQLNCLRGSFVLNPDHPGTRVIDGRIAAMLGRPASGTRKMTARDVARRLGLQLDTGTCRVVGAALRRHLGPPKVSNGQTTWQVPDVWFANGTIHREG